MRVKFASSVGPTYEGEYALREDRGVAPRSRERLACLLDAGLPLDLKDVQGAVDLLAGVLAVEEEA